MRAAANLRERVGQDGVTQLGAQPGHRGRERGVGLRPGHDEAALDLRQFSGQLRRHWRAGRARAWSHPNKGLSIGPASVGYVVHVVWRGGRHGHQRLAKGKVEVDDAGRNLQRLGDSPAGNRADVPQQVARGLRQGHFAEPLGIRPVEPKLVNRLGRARVAQLWRAVGREHHEWDTRIVRLDNGWHEVGGRGAGGAQQNDWLLFGLSQAEGKEPGRTLVQVHPKLDGRVIGEPHGQRRGA